MEEPATVTPDTAVLLKAIQELGAERQNVTTHKVGVVEHTTSSPADPKPGIKSTELYFSAAVAIVGGLAALGFLDPNMIDTTQLGADVGTIVDAVTRIVGAVTAAWVANNYTDKRAKVKAAAAAREDMP